MYIQLVDRDGFLSEVLYIHSDKDEFMTEVNNWKKNLLDIIKTNKYTNGLPLGRLEAQTCMVDLIRHLGNYYVESTPLSFIPAGNVWSCLKLASQNEVLEYGEPIIEIKTYE